MPGVTGRGMADTGRGDRPSFYPVAVLAPSTSNMLSATQWPATAMARGLRNATARQLAVPDLTTEKLYRAR